MLGAKKIIGIKKHKNYLDYKQKFKKIGKKVLNPNKFYGQVLMKTWLDYESSWIIVRVELILKKLICQIKINFKFKIYKIGFT